MMSAYWDSSAVVKALKVPAVMDLLEADGMTRAHTLSEVFSLLSGGALKDKLKPDEAAKVVRDLASRIQVITLPPAEQLNAMDEARSYGVTGGLIHDFLHAYAARIHNASRIYTLDPDFRMFQGMGIPIETP